MNNEESPMNNPKLSPHTSVMNSHIVSNRFVEYGAGSDARGGGLRLL
jgi:hypothetical protein